MRRLWDGVRVCERVIMADQMTFEQFRPYIQQKYAAVFAAGFALPSQVNPVLDVPVGEPLHKVVRFMAKIVANDFGGLLILALYGYGLSGAKVARSMFEASVNAAYLAKHPECVDDYIDFHVVVKKKFYDHLLKYDATGCESDRSGEDRGNGNGARAGVAPLQETQELVDGR